ncbi:hypothetical protein Tco_1417647 [Tanacetum coccineum]
MEKKDTLSSCSDSEKQQMQLIQDNHKSKESCMIQTKEEKIYTSNSLDALDASSVIIESNGTESTEQDTTPDQRNDSQVDEAEIRPIIYEDQWPKVQASVVNVKWRLLKITLQAPSGLVLHQMTSDHNRSELGIQDHSNEQIKFNSRYKSCSLSKQDSYITTRVGITIPPSHSNAEDNR